MFLPVHKVGVEELGCPAQNPDLNHGEHHCDHYIPGIGMTVHLSWHQCLALFYFFYHLVYKNNCFPVKLKLQQTPLEKKKMVNWDMFVVRWLPYKPSLCVLWKRIIPCYLNKETDLDYWVKEFFWGRTSVQRRLGWKENESKGGLSLQSGLKKIRIQSIIFYIIYLIIISYHWYFFYSEKASKAAHTFHCTFFGNWQYRNMFSNDLRQGGNVYCGMAAMPAGNKNSNHSNPMTLLPIKKYVLWP